MHLKPFGGYFADTGRLNNSAYLFFADVEPVRGWTPEPGVRPVLVTAKQIERMIATRRLGLHHVALWQFVTAAGLDRPKRRLARSARRRQ